MIYYLHTLFSGTINTWFHWGTYYCVLLTLILIYLFCCNKWLVKEPISHNPFKLIYRVTKYTINYKYPQNPSAFTYYEDEVISRIDYGKSKYGIIPAAH